MWQTNGKNMGLSFLSCKRGTQKQVLELWFSAFGISCMLWRILCTVRNRMYYLRTPKGSTVSLFTEKKEEKWGEELVWVYGKMRCEHAAPGECLMTLPVFMVCFPPEVTQII